MEQYSRFRRLLVLAVAFALLIGVTSASAQSWKFGVISDTQWTLPDDGKNPNTSAADIIRQLDRQFIAHGVKFVVDVGDMVDTGSQANDYARALYAQDLYNAGIGFYPLRGNHEAANGTYTGSGADFVYAYPQIVPGPGAGLNNNTPNSITALAYITPPIDLDPYIGNPPATETNPRKFRVGTNFSAPGENAVTGGVSYSFQYNNATFVLLDQFLSPDYYTSYIPAQQAWINSTLSGRPANTHAFAFTHKNILGGNHKDNMFGGQVTAADPGDGYGVSGLSVADAAILATKQGNENTFLASLQTYKVKYMISGHDHHHYNSVVTSFDGSSKVHQLITQSDSSKFYTPVTPVSANDMPVEQELGRVGLYIFTVDGPRVTIDYYADDGHGTSWITTKTTPALNLVKRSTAGYSLNGKEKLIAQGAPYAIADDTTIAATMERGFLGTSMAILGGSNSSNVTTNYGKKTEKAVNTGWAPAEKDLASDILTLWGMADLGTNQTESYVLQMSYDKHGPPSHAADGNFGIATRNTNGDWTNAVDNNIGGPASTFVNGPWHSNYGLGTYGVDSSTNTAWAVINYNGDFAVSRHIEP